MSEPAGGPGPGPATPPLEDGLLRDRHERAVRYIRDKVDELLKVIGTSPLRPEELDDETLIGLDPIGIVAGSFRQVLSHLSRTNEQLRFAREELQAIFDCAGLGILVIDREQRIVACNAKFREQFVVGDVELAGRSCREVVCKTDRPDRPCPFMQTLQTGESYRSPDWIVGGRHFDIVETAVRNLEGEVTGSVLVYSDISERIAAEEALRRSEERYRDLFENTNDLIFSTGPDGSIEYVNAAWCSSLGYSRQEAERLSLLDLLHPDCDAECRERLSALLRGDGGGSRVQASLVAKDGRKVLLEGSVSMQREGGQPIGLRGIFRDITNTEILEEELRRREKLESIGVLAGGIAHDFNNILTAILGNISLAQAVAAPGETVQERLAEAEKATLAARALTQQLLTFSKGGSPVKRLVAIGPLVQEQTVFACRGSNVFCQITTDPQLWATEIDEGQIGQVVNNLVLNAVQAMNGGTVIVGADNVAVDRQDDPLLPPGRYVRITVRDSGCGIERENLQRMFDPYFTTKPGGSGLGLAVTYSIVKQHGGHIRVESEVGTGTTFFVYLPASRREAPAPEKPAGAVPSGIGRVLVMDDERIVREIAAAMLEELGYDAECAGDGGAAIEIYERARAEGRPFTAVIMDLTVPGGMGGKEAIGRLLARDPAVRALVSSGYSNDPVMADFAAHGFCGVITKPYRLADLAAALNAATAGAPAAQ